MCKATYEFLVENGVIYGRIPGFDGVWATAETLEACREELLEVLEDWILIGLRMNHELPVIDGIDLKVEKVA